MKCFIFLDKCSPGNKYICKNGGTCIISSKGDATCACGDKYDGPTCETGKYISSVFIFVWATY